MNLSIFFKPLNLNLMWFLIDFVLIATFTLFGMDSDFERLNKLCNLTVPIYIFVS